MYVDVFLLRTHKLKINLAKKTYALLLTSTQQTQFRRKYLMLLHILILKLCF